MAYTIHRKGRDMATKPLTPEEKAKRAEALKTSARQAMADYHDERQRIEENRARLKALRLARDEKQAAEAKPSTPTPEKRRRAASRFRKG